jgi:hypothetical protein
MHKTTSIFKNPDDDFERISKHLSTIRPSKHFYNSKEYAILLQDLEALAATKKYFYYSADKLLEFISNEVEFDVQEYNNYIRFARLFYNSNTRIETSLKERQKYLISRIESAKKTKNYDQSYVLIKTLGVAADVHSQESYTSLDPDYDEYITVAVKLLMQNAGKKNGLGFISEQSLHILLKSTITNPHIRGASEIPYIIFRLFLHHNRQWDMDPFIHLSYLKEYIDNIRHYFITETVKLLTAKIAHKIKQSIANDLELFLFFEFNVWKDNLPDIIFDFFLKSTQTYDFQPFVSQGEHEKCRYIIEKKFTSCRETIKLLEYHLARLESFRGDRRFITESFKLYLGSKKAYKICKIDIIMNSEESLELHKQLSLAERLMSSHTDKLYEIDRQFPNCTYLVANFGLVFSNMPHQINGPHQRIFKSIPIKIHNVVIAGQLQGQGVGHAEEGLYEYLLQEENIHYFLTEFRKQYHLNTDNYKIYAVIFDLHGTYDMCLSCSTKGEDFQNQFRHKLLTLLLKENIKTLHKCPTQLPIIIRYSSDLHYHYKYNPYEDKQGILFLMSQEGQKRELAPAENTSFDPQRDIKKFSANLLLHGNFNWHELWSEYRKDFYNHPLSLLLWTAFVSMREYKKLSNEAKTRNHTPFGKIDTALPEDLPHVNHLSIG